MRIADGWARNSIGYLSLSCRAWDGIRGTRFSHLLMSSLRMPILMFIMSAFGDDMMENDYVTIARGWSNPPRCLEEPRKSSPSAAGIFHACPGRSRWEESASP